MRRFVAVAVLAVVSVITVALVVAYRDAIQSKTRERDELEARQLADSGTDFLLEDKPVRALLTVTPLQVKVNNSTTAILRLTTLATSATAGLGNERDGDLAPSLQAADCKVDSPSAQVKSTKLMIAAFVWRWAVTCTSAGRKDILVTLAFESPDKSNDSDPMPFQTLRQFSAYDDWSTSVLGALAIGGGIASIISALALVTDVTRKYKRDLARS